MSQFTPGVKAKSSFIYRNDDTDYDIASMKRTKIVIVKDEHELQMKQAQNQDYQASVSYVFSGSKAYDSLNHNIFTC